eukprot:scaffold244566_cov20-Prasinocladus_malaysianus.AAC.1
MVGMRVQQTGAGLRLSADSVGHLRCRRSLLIPHIGFRRVGDGTHGPIHPAPGAFDICQRRRLK